MKIITLPLLACLFITSAFADNYNDNDKHQCQTDDSWGHNHEKIPAQGDYNWDKHADRGSINWNNN